MKNLSLIASIVALVVAAAAVGAAIAIPGPTGPAGAPGANGARGANGTNGATRPAGPGRLSGPPETCGTESFIPSAAFREPGLAGKEETGEGVRSLHPLMHWLLYAASALVALAGFQLFVLSEQTATTFAWTIANPLTAASLGAAYWSAVPVEFLAARQREWAKARIAVPGVWAFTTLTLVVTVVHAGVFHFSSADPVPRAAAWFWLGIYAGVPVAMIAAWGLQRRLPPGDPPREARFPGWLRVFLIVEGSGMTVAGLALFLAPDATRSVWPWALTTLTARAIGAWLLALGVITFHALREDDLARTRPFGAGLLFFGILELVALARYPGPMAWGSLGATIYLLFLASLLPAGVYVSFGPGLGRFLRRRRA